METVRTTAGFSLLPASNLIWWSLFRHLRVALRERQEREPAEQLPERNDHLGRAGGDPLHRALLHPSLHRLGSGGVKLPGFVAKGND